GAAAAVDFSRVRARQHFPSDVLVGSVLGYLVAQSVYHRRHEPQLGGGAWEPPSEFTSEEGKHSPANMGSPYVPLDSWLDPLFDRLIGLGYVQSAFQGMRPWTRMQCAQLLGEAMERFPFGIDESEASRIHQTLVEEFREETARLEGAANIGVRLDSIYQRTT